MLFLPDLIFHWKKSKHQTNFLVVTEHLQTDKPNFSEKSNIEKS